MIYFIADTHFLHKNIIKYCNRPEDCDKQMIKNWINIVKNDDIVIHLGDVACGYKGQEDKLRKIFELLPGEKYLIKGNHDTKENEFYTNFLNFKKVSDYMILENVFCCHYPFEINLYTDLEVSQKILEFMKIFKENNCEFLLHGHTHNKKSLFKYAYNVSVENNNYSPLSLENCLKDLKAYKGIPQW